MRFTKEINITPSIEAAIRRVNNGEEIDLNQIAVFEAKSLNTRPLRRRTGLYANAIMDKSVLEEMTAFLNGSNEGVPIHIMHNRDALNVGKAFQAVMTPTNDGHWELSTQFFVAREFKELVASLNSGVVDQVSVGVLSKEVKCKDCGFDWRTAEFENLIAMQDNEGHSPGIDGNYVVGHGMDQWLELSAVNTGAATDARIVSQERSKFVNRDELYRLAAVNQNHPETSMALIANLTEVFSEDTTGMNKDEVQALIDAALQANKEATEVDLQAKIDAAVTAAVEPKDAEITALTAKVAELEAAASTDKDTKITDLEAQLTALEPAIVFLKDQSKLAQVAAGSNAPVEVKSADEAITKIKDSGVMIAKLFAKKESSAEDTGTKTSANLDGLAAFGIKDKR